MPAGSRDLHSPEVRTIPVPGELVMVEYRAYFITEDDHFQKVRVLNCPDDATAMAQAEALLDGHDIELGQLDRMVIRLDCKKK